MTWSDNLLDVIRLNIGGMNPKLKDYLDRITELKERNKQLENNKSDLEDYTQAIKEMISWKEI